MYHHGELKPMQQMQWQEHTKWSNPSLRNQTKVTNAMERFKRKNKEEKHEELQNLDLLFHQSISPLREWNPLDLYLGVALYFPFVLSLISLHNISCFGGI